MTEALTDALTDGAIIAGAGILPWLYFVPREWMADRRFRREAREMISQRKQARLDRYCSEAQFLQSCADHDACVVRDTCGRCHEGIPVDPAAFTALRSRYQQTSSRARGLQALIDLENLGDGNQALHWASVVHGQALLMARLFTIWSNVKSGETSDPPGGYHDCPTCSAAPALSDSAEMLATALTHLAGETPTGARATANG